MRTHKRTNIHMHESEKFGPDNWESQANMKRVLSFTFRSLFQGEIRILKEANYQSQGKGGEHFKGVGKNHLTCRLRTKMWHWKTFPKVQERDVREGRRATNPPLLLESGDTRAALGAPLPSQSYNKSSANYPVICSELSTARQSR